MDKENDIKKILREIKDETHENNIMLKKIL